MKFKNHIVEKIVSNCEYLQGSKMFYTWLKRAKYSQNSESAYANGMKYYCHYHEMTPEELINEHEAEIENGTKPADYTLQDRFFDFLEWAQDEGRSDNTIAMYRTGVSSFYRSRNITMPTEINKRKSINTLLKNDWDGFSKTEIRRALQHLNLRNKAIVLSIISTGLAKDDLIELPLDILKNRDGTFIKPDTDGLIELKIIRGKTGVKFTTFLTSEAYTAIMEYLEYRKNRIEFHQENEDARANKAGRQPKQIIDDCPYLFCSIYRNEFEKLSNQAYNDIFKNLNVQMGAEYTGEKWQYMKMRSHNLRKFFKSQLQNDGTPAWVVEHTMGHALKGTDKHYFEVDKHKLRELFGKHQHAININRDVEQVYSAKDTALMNDLKDEVAELKEQKNLMAAKMASMTVNEDALLDRLMQKMYAKGAPAAVPAV